MSWHEYVQIPLSARNSWSPDELMSPIYLEPHFRIPLRNFFKRSYVVWSDGCIMFINGIREEYLYVSAPEIYYKRVLKRLSLLGFL